MLGVSSQTFHRAVKTEEDIKLNNLGEMYMIYLPWGTTGLEEEQRSLSNYRLSLKLPKCVACAGPLKAGVEHVGLS